jgi:hypothetical protein
MSKPVCVISEHDFVASIADALQYVAVHHPSSFVRALAEGYAAEDSPAARDAIAQILEIFPGWVRRAPAWASVANLIAATEFPLASRPPSSPTTPQSSARA